MIGGAVIHRIGHEARALTAANARPPLKSVEVFASPSESHLGGLLIPGCWQWYVAIVALARTKKLWRPTTFFPRRVRVTCAL